MKTHLVELHELTYAESRWYAHTQQILVDHEDGEEETIFGPNFGNSRPPPPHQDGYQPAAVDYHQEVHPLANHIYRHQETNLLKRIIREENAPKTKSFYNFYNFYIIIFHYCPGLVIH